MRYNSYIFLSATFCIIVLSACIRAEPRKTPALEDDAVRVLPIPARRQHPDSPETGWCGETAIQEALLYYGTWASQRFINAAGKPRNPDLYSDDLPVALKALGLPFEIYRPARSRDYESFAHWVRGSIDRGVPVLIGVKILPTQNPRWDVDHFVLAVGYGKSGILVNTTWGRREWVDDKAVKGLSLQNPSFAIRILPPGVLASSDQKKGAARLSVVGETRAVVTLRVECPGKEPNIMPVVLNDGKPRTFRCDPASP